MGPQSGPRVDTYTHTYAQLPYTECVDRCGAACKQVYDHARRSDRRPHARTRVSHAARAVSAFKCEHNQMNLGLFAHVRNANCTVIFILFAACARTHSIKCDSIMSLYVCLYLHFAGTFSCAIFLYCVSRFWFWFCVCVWSVCSFRAYAVRARNSVAR